MKYAKIWVFPKIVGFPPQIIHFNRVFHYKPSILGLFLETPIWMRYAKICNEECDVKSGGVLVFEES